MNIKQLFEKLNSDLILVTTFSQDKDIDDAKWVFNQYKTDIFTYKAIINTIVENLKEELKDTDLLTADIDKLNTIFWMTRILNEADIDDFAEIADALLVQMTHPFVDSLFNRSKAKNPGMLDGQIQDLALQSRFKTHLLANKLAPLGIYNEEPKFYNSYLLANIFDFLVLQANQNITSESFYLTLKQYLLANPDYLKNTHPEMLFDSMVHVIKKLENKEDSNMLFTELQDLCELFGLPYDILYKAFKEGQLENYDAFEAAITQAPKVIVIAPVQQQPPADAPLAPQQAPQAIGTFIAEVKGKNNLFVGALIKGYADYYYEKTSESIYRFKTGTTDVQKAFSGAVSSLVTGFTGSSEPKTVASVVVTTFSEKKDPLVHAINPNEIEPKNLKADQLNPDQQREAVLEFFKYVMGRYVEGDTKDRLYIPILSNLQGGSYHYSDSDRGKASGVLQTQITDFLIDQLKAQKEPIVMLRAYLERLTTLLAFFPDFSVEVLFRNTELRNIFMQNHLLPYLLRPNPKIDANLIAVLSSIVGSYPIGAHAKTVSLTMLTLLNAFQDATRNSEPWSRLERHDPEARCRQMIGMFTQSGFSERSAQGVQHHALISRTLLILLQVTHYCISAPAKSQYNRPFMEDLLRVLEKITYSDPFKVYLSKYKQHFIQQINYSVSQVLKNSKLTGEGFSFEQARVLKDSLDLLKESFSIQDTELDPTVQDFYIILSEKVTEGEKLARGTGVGVQHLYVRGIEQKPPLTLKSAPLPLYEAKAVTDDLTSMQEEFGPKAALRPDQQIPEEEEEEAKNRHKNK